MRRLGLAILIAAMMLLTAASVLAETNGDYEYTVQDGKATITRYSGAETALTVPSALNGSPVTAIGEMAFMGCFDLTSVTIPEGITEIGEVAFFSCGSLTSVSLPDSLVSLGASAFHDCQSLESITIPKNVTALAANPFTGCEALAEITVAPGSAALEIREGLLYNRADSTLVCWPKGLASGACAVPSGTAAIGTEAFLGCDNITAVTLPDSVTAIRENAFRFCQGMTSIRLPSGISVLEDGAFEGCVSLETITLPAGITRIAPLLLKDCSSLTAVTVPDGVQSIGYNAFNNCSELTRVILPSSLTEIGVFAFDCCDKLTDIYFNGTQERWNAISVDDFNDPLTGASLRLPAPREAEVDLPEDLTTIESKAFADLQAGTIVRMHADLTQIADDAFPPASMENPVTFIAPPGSRAETWCITNGYTVWFEMP